MKILLGLSLIFYLAGTCVAREPVIISAKNLNAPTKLPEGVTKNVLIIGAGLAGLSAGLELAERGYSITIKEKHYFGGKLFSEPVEVFPGKTFQVEHGFHAWFHNYYNFKDIRDRLKINSNFRKWDKVHFYFKDYKPEVMWSSGPYPLNLLGIMMRSPNLNLIDGVLSAFSTTDLMFYDFDYVNDKYDNMTFYEWAQKMNVRPKFYDIIMQPGLSVTLNEREVFSAAEMLAIMQIYFLSDAESDNREVPIYSFEQAVLKPWREKLLSYNAKILMNTTVKSLKIDAETMNVFGTVDVNGDDDESIYDYVVMAADIGAVQTILNETLKSYAAEAAIAAVVAKVNSESISKMKVAPPYKVLRVWFDKQLSEEFPDILETPDYGPVNLIAQYHMLEEEFILWAAETGGSVLEFHLYTWDKNFAVNASDDQVWPLIIPTVRQILPEIFDRDFKLLAYHVNSYQNFASFQKGLFKARPTVDYFAKNGLNSIFLAGDWIKTNYPSALMERAVSTGREAANEILLKDNVRQVCMTVTNHKGPGLF